MRPKINRSHLLIVFFLGAKKVKRKTKTKQEITKNSLTLVFPLSFLCSAGVFGFVKFGGCLTMNKNAWVRNFSPKDEASAVERGLLASWVREPGPLRGGGEGGGARAAQGRCFLFFFSFFF